MLFNFTKKYQFKTILKLNEENIEIVNKSKLLGTIITDNLTWDENTDYLIKKALYKRMQLLQKVATFTSSKEDKKCIYISYIRSILEQSCVVWHSSLTIDK